MNATWTQILHATTMASIRDEVPKVFAVVTREERCSRKERSASFAFIAALCGCTCRRRSGIMLDMNDVSRRELLRTALGAAAAMSLTGCGTGRVAPEQPPRPSAGPTGRRGSSPPHELGRCTPR